MENKNEEKVYEKNRFEFSLFVNENLVCKRNFKINNFSEVSVQSIDFKHTMEDIVKIIDDDLKSKSRLYTWYNYDTTMEDGEFNEPLEEPWAYTFKIVFTDNDREVFSQIWDGRYYPRDIRQNVDLINKFMQVGTYQDGNPIMKEYSKVDKTRLDIDHYIKYIIGSNRTNLVDVIIKKICEVCSPEHVWYKDGKIVKEGCYSDDSDYALNDIYKTTEKVTEKINGEDIKKIKVISSIKYDFSINKAYYKMSNNLAKKLADKTEKYFNDECNNMFSKHSLTRKNHLKTVTENAK